jgi:hypothetical protein
MVVSFDLIQICTNRNANYGKIAAAENICEIEKFFCDKRNETWLAYAVELIKDL